MLILGDKVAKLENQNAILRKTLEDLLGERVTAFSYPHGKFNSLVKNEVLEAGYSLAFTSHYDINQIGQDKLALNTNEIWNSDNLFCFIKKMKGDWDWLKFRNL